jgi:hypothetical protein
MIDNPPIHAGQVLTGSLFNEPMRVVTVSSHGRDDWMARPVDAHLVMKQNLSIEELLQPTRPFRRSLRA